MSNLLRKIISMAMSAVIFIGVLNGCSLNDADDSTVSSEIVENQRLVEPVENLSPDFIKGMDISSVIAEEQSGVVYRNFDGEQQDIFKTLSESGVNYIRVRVWNNPYDENGKGYGGGNCDIAKALEIGKRAAQYNMKLLVDFHYSDFWADPSRQLAPKEWQRMSLEQKKSALREYTQNSLNEIINGGADVGIVQIGNEINNGMAGENDNSAVIQLLKEASEAVRSVSKDIRVAVHYTDINDKNKTLWYAQNLAENQVDYDIFGVTYYPCWHGSMENLTNVLSEIKKQYSKDTLVLETSYPSTVEDSDGFGNSVGYKDILTDYSADEKGQAKCVRDVINAVNNAGGIGVFYWEGAWISVGEADYNANLPIWEKYGSGWASSYGAAYDPEGVGEYYGGSSWDNQAMFYPDGTPRQSLNVFNMV